jgi:hypothetical protein
MSRKKKLSFDLKFEGNGLGDCGFRIADCGFKKASFDKLRTGRAWSMEKK